MDDLFAHPVIVATYVALLSAAFAGVRALFNLFNRVKRLEEETKRVREEIHSLSEDLHTHMIEEEKSAAQMKATLEAIQRQLAKP